MSKAYQSRNKEKRKKEKKARKEAQRARYKAWADEGMNRKSKRHRGLRKIVKWRKKNGHPHGRCGNTGCKRCNRKAA